MAKGKNISRVSDGLFSQSQDYEKENIMQEKDTTKKVIKKEKTVGRPKAKDLKNGEKTRVTSIELRESNIMKLAIEQARTGKGQSEIIRGLIDKYLSE